MAKCIKCGRKGLFLKVNKEGRCNDCEVNYQSEHEHDLSHIPTRQPVEIKDDKSIVPVSNKLEKPTIKVSIHEDIKSLLWFGDGPNKNFSEKDMEEEGNTWHIGDITTRIVFNINEPSLIFTGADIKIPEDESLVPRPPYFPHYENLDPCQKYIYLKLLANPYNTDIDIGYVFILYYGLERHLLQGDFDSAFKVILKLRDAHKNKSFQNYSGNALILSSMLKGKGEYALLFIKSLDKDYEYNFSENLFLICYYSFNMPLLAKDIMRMAKAFEFTNANYIKKYPDIFEECLKDVIAEKTGDDKIDVKKYVTNAELKKLKSTKVMIFANSSIMNNSMPVPQLADNFKLKKEMNILLESAHMKTKEKIAKARKDGTIDKHEPSEVKPKEIVKHGPPEARLLREPTDMSLDELNYFYQEQISAFYLRREEDKKYLDMAIKACECHIAIAKDVVNKRLAGKKSYTPYTLDEMTDRIISGNDIEKKYHGIELPTDFNPKFHRSPDDFEIIYEPLGIHIGYNQLCIIREKEGNYQEVIRLAEQAKKEGWKGDWDKRIEKAKKKLKV